MYAQWGTNKCLTTSLGGGSSVLQCSGFKYSHYGLFQANNMVCTEFIKLLKIEQLTLQLQYISGYSFWGRAHMILKLFSAILLIYVLCPMSLCPYVPEKEYKRQGKSTLFQLRFLPQSTKYFSKSIHHRLLHLHLPPHHHPLLHLPPLLFLVLFSLTTPLFAALGFSLAWYTAISFS